MFRICDFIFLQSDAKQRNHGIKYSLNIRNLQYKALMNKPQLFIYCKPTYFAMSLN